MKNYLNSRSKSVILSFVIVFFQPLGGCTKLAMSRGQIVVSDSLKADNAALEREAQVRTEQRRSSELPSVVELNNQNQFLSAGQLQEKNSYDQRQSLNKVSVHDPGLEVPFIFRPPRVT